MATNVPVNEVADDLEPANIPKANQEEDSSSDGNSEEETREMPEALDGLGMLPLSHATPLSLVLPEATKGEHTKNNLKLVANPISEQSSQTEANEEANSSPPSPPN